MPGSRASQSSPPSRVWLRFAPDQEEVELSFGVTVIGRGDTCQVMVEDPLMSRQHVCLVVDERGVSLKDLGSTNGVKVNGKRVNESCVLRAGDKIAMGQSEAELCILPSVEDSGRFRNRTRDMVETIADIRASVPPPSKRALNSWDEENTINGSGLFTLATVAEKALDLGQGPAAERLLSRSLTRLLDHAVAGLKMDPTEIDTAGLLACRLASLMGRGDWINYALSLFTETCHLPSAPVVDHLCRVLRSVNGVSVARYREYLGKLGPVAGELTPAERFLLRRLEGLQGALTA